MIDVKVDATALRGMLDQLPKRLRRRTLSRGLREGAKVVAAAAIANTPVRTGALKAAIKVRAERGASRKGRVSLLVISGRKTLGKSKRFRSAFNDAYYGSFIEFGWRPGSRTARRRTGKKVPYSKILTGYQSWRTWKKSGRPAAIGDARVMVPGVHMIENAYRSTRQQATKVVEQTIRREILVAAAELLNKANSRNP